MKKTLVLTLVLILAVTTATLAKPKNISIAYGNFDIQNSDGDLSTTFLKYKDDNLFGYQFEGRFGIGDADDLDSEAEFVDLTLYNPVKYGKGKNYIGLGFKSIKQEGSVSGLKLDLDAYVMPIKFKTVQNINTKTRFIGKAGWFPGVGEYTADSNMGIDLEGDVEGYTLEATIIRDITKDFAVKVGYLNEDYTYNKDESAGVDEFEDGFDGFYLGGIMNF